MIILSSMKWKEKRINAINRKIKNGSAKGYSAQHITEGYIDEYDRLSITQRQVIKKSKKPNVNTSIMIM